MHDVAVIGAGPYGLSLAAHLAARGTDFRIFGIPMRTWQENMPRGMRLKSEGFASTLYDPEGAFPLARYCSDNAIDYADVGSPVELETFIEYGLAFQRRFAPELDTQEVVSIAQRPNGFAVATADGRVTSFRKVVLAVGITHYRHVAAPLDTLPDQHVSHSSAHRDYAEFAGRRVAVVGGGSSATDCAAALAQAGASVTVLTRRPELKFHNPPRPRTMRDRLRSPVTTIGYGWKLLLLERGPVLFHALPETVRHDVTRRTLGPASCWFTRSSIEAAVGVTTGVTVTGATLRQGRVALALAGDGGASVVEADHVIAATGYRVDLGRLGFLDPNLRGRIRTAADTPVLSRWFESSVPGLFFVGVSSANAFGPLVRFACGAQFTARRLTRHLVATRGHAVPRHRPDARTTVPAELQGEAVRAGGSRSWSSAGMNRDGPDRH